MSYRELDESSTLLARWFLAQGLQPGERVALHWSNSIEVVQLLFGLFKAGLIAVLVNTRLKPSEIEYILDHSQARMCFSEPALALTAKQSCPVRHELPALKSDAQPLDVLPAINPDQPAAILYTSGTTARPKGVTHSHRSLFHTAAMLPRELFDTNDVGLAITQVMHAAALNALLLPAIYLGASVALVPSFDPGAVLDAIQRFRCTTMVCLPTLLQFLLDEQVRAPREVSCLRSIYVGGDSVSVALQDRFRGVFGRAIQEAYGMTETLLITVNPKDENRPGSLGLAVQGFELRLVDLEDRDVPDGETGEILVRSAANCIRYWNDPQATRAAMGDGWLRTGDLARRDVDGYYWFQGRKKEIIIRAGSNISPQEVEEVLYRHLAVREAGVVGAPDPVYGEIVAAFLVLREGRTLDLAELRSFAQHYLADYKLPEKLVLLEELPKSPTGKVQRRALKERLEAHPEMIHTREVARAYGLFTPRVDP